MQGTVVNKNDGFDEPEFIKLLFLLGDIQSWLDDMSRRAFSMLPLDNKKKFFRKTYYLTADGLAHILERHYYKINRHPQAGKFQIGLIEILHCIREASMIEPVPIKGSLNFQRTIRTEQPIGVDNKGQYSNLVIIITDGGGKIITAFPGSSII